MTRLEMKTQFKGLMNRRDLTDTLADTFLNQALMRVQRELRAPAMEKSVNVTVGSPWNGLVIPNDYIQLKAITPAASQTRLRMKNIDTVLLTAKSVGTPTIFCRRGGVWMVGPTPSKDDVLRVDYYAELPPLIKDTDENILSIVAWDLVVYAALSFAADWFTDKRAPTFETRYQQILNTLQDQADEDELGADATVEPALIYPPDCD